MIFAPGMDNAVIQTETGNTICSLEKRLRELSGRYLNGSNSIYSLYFCRIPTPESSSLAGRVTLQEGIRGFVKNILGGAMREFVLVDESKADVFQSIGTIPPVQEDLTDVFTTTIIGALESLHASIYPLTEDGTDQYEELLDPVLWSVSAVAVHIDDMWFILMCSWSD